VELRNNPQIALALKDGMGIYHASGELRKNPEVVMAVVEKNPENLRLASDELKNNPDIVMAVMKENEWAGLQPASVEFKDNSEKRRRLTPMSLGETGTC